MLIVKRKFDYSRFLFFEIVINAGSLQISSVTGADGSSGVHSLTQGGGGSTIVQYTQSQDGQQFFVPGKEYYEINCRNVLL